MAKQQKNEVSFEEVVARGCGLDVHKKEIVATVSGTNIKKENTYVPVDNEIFDTIERMAIGTWCYPCSNGEHRSLLEAGDEHP